MTLGRSENMLFEKIQFTMKLCPLKTTLQLNPLGIFFWSCGLKIQNTQLVFEKLLGNSKNRKAILRLIILERLCQKKCMAAIVWNMNPAKTNLVKSVLASKEVEFNKNCTSCFFFFFQKTNFGVCDHAISSLRLEPRVWIMQFKFLIFSQISLKTYH